MQPPTNALGNADTLLEYRLLMLLGDEEVTTQV